MKKPILRVEGWRGISHSFALVHQRQLLAWLDQDALVLQHHDLPYYQSGWNTVDHDAGFSAADRARLNALNEDANVNPDAVYRISFPAALSAARSASTPQYTFMVCEYGLPASYLNAALRNPAALCRDGDRVVTPSRWARDMLVRFGMPEARVDVVPHGVCSRSFHPLEADERTALRRVLGFESGHFVFCNAGIPTWNKGLDKLLTAFARLHARHPHTRLVLKNHRTMYGQGADEVFRSVARSHPGLLSEAVMRSIFLIENNLSQADLKSVYACADCYVAPYRAEGFNLPVLEAMACGTPVIVTDGGSTDDFCPPGLATRVISRLEATTPDRFIGGLWLDVDDDGLLCAMAEAVDRGPRRLAGEAWQRHIDGMQWSTAARALKQLMFPLPAEAAAAAPTPATSCA